MSHLTLSTGTVRYPAREPREYEHGPRINAVVTLSTGEDVKLWGDPDSEIATLRKSQPVQVCHDGKTWKLVNTSSPPSSASIPTEPTDAEKLVKGAKWTDAQKRAIAERTTELANLMGYCIERAIAQAQKLPQQPTSQDIQDIASTLFIQINREF